jgi:predicted  nucleic acid-binding Zn-ribbon protein
MPSVRPSRTSVATSVNSARSRRAGHGPPRSESLQPVSSPVEAGGEDRQGRWRHHRRADALSEAGSDQQACARCQPCGQGGQREDRGAGEEDPAASEQVRHAAAEQEEPAIGQQVATEDPLKVLDGEVQVAADRRERDVDDRGVQEVQERHGAQQGQEEFPLASGQE